jgi:hypothetical protein
VIVKVFDPQAGDTHLMVVAEPDTRMPGERGKPSTQMVLTPEEATRLGLEIMHALRTIQGHLPRGSCKLCETNGWPAPSYTVPEKTCTYHRCVYCGTSRQGFEGRPEVQEGAAQEGVEKK